MRVGVLFEITDRKGVGKLVSAGNGRCTLQVFHSVRQQEVVEVAASELARAYLSPQTRIYVLDGERYCIGRVVHYAQNADGTIEYEVRFPNGRQAFVNETDLFVRPWVVPDDPAEVLACGGAESQFLYDRRLEATKALFSLRAAAQGLTALVSAGIELVPHQVAAVRKILSDPVQRYVLADEVGLGKTIEAGLVIRQHVIDDPETRVLVAAPQHLLGQWRSELSAKLRLDQFGDAFECVAHDELTRAHSTPDLLVIDEAHHLVGVDSGPLAAAARRLVDLAQRCPRLLLLSATPALGEERRFLALLNLLDPLAHPLDDLEGFRAKLTQRREYGRLLLGLDPEGHGLVLRQRATEAQRLFPNDAVVGDLAPRIVAGSRAGDPDLPTHCRALRQHIANTYRVHHRLIRSRRADAAGWEFRRRGPAPGVSGEIQLSHVREECDDDPRTLDAWAILEDWRAGALNAVDAQALDRIAAARRYWTLLEAFALGTAEFLAVLESAPVLFAAEREIRAALHAALAGPDSDEQRLGLMVTSTIRLRRALLASAPRAKIVVFSSSTRVARAFHTRLSEADRDVVPILLTCDLSPTEMDVAVADFSSRDADVLVTDRAGEEGLNLNFADAIVHLDVPFSAARMEQRLGRLDRFGRLHDIIRHRVFVPCDDDASPWSAWQRLLAEGFLVFNESISDVQFLLEAIEEEAAVALLSHGAAGLERLVEVVRGRICEERRSQDEQSALDRIAMAEEPADSLIEAIEQAEEDEHLLERAVDDWLVGALLFKKRPYAYPQTDPFKLGAMPGTLVPKLPWLAEFAIDDAAPLTWRRRIASRDPSVTLLRPGTPFVDALERFTRWDDRGTAFATWRVVENWTADPILVFRLCVTVEPDASGVDQIFPTPEDRALLRNAQQFLSPMLEIVHLGVDGASVEDPTILKLLEWHYDKDAKGGGYRDVNLSSRPTLLHNIIDRASFEVACRAVRDQARAAIMGSERLRGVIAAAVVKAQSNLGRCRARTTHGSAGAREIEIAEQVLSAVATPAVRIEAIGLFVVAGTPPTGGRE